MRVPGEGGSRGFSLIELMIAMVVTLVVSGAIYGLMAGGQTAFQREPLLVERQQNIRIAMDVIVRDVENAGTAMPVGTQVFTAGLDNWSASNSPVSRLTAAQRTYLGLSGSAGTDLADALEVLTNDGSCPTLTTSSACGAPGVDIYTNEPLPGCLNPTAARGSLAYVSGPGGPATKGGSGAGPTGLLYLFAGAGPGCGATGYLGAPTAQSTLNPAAADACQNVGGNSTCSFVALAQWVRYQIAPENPTGPVDPLRNPYALWRSDSGLWNYDGSVGTDPPGAGGANNPWRLIARGIEDLQVQYQTGAEWPATPNVWLDTPPVATTDPATMVQRVRITLSGYAVGSQTQVGGETQGAGTDPGSIARRGQLTTIVTPRSALQVVYAANLWR